MSNYQDMLGAAVMAGHPCPSADSADLAALREVIRNLPAAAVARAVKAAAVELERQRAEYARASAPGHQAWYGEKVARCAALERMKDMGLLAHSS